jgi:hypothetical protein
VTASSVDPEHLKCKRGFENQRRADNGDGTFLNPIPACDHPDPTTLRDGDRWLMTFSSLESHPGRVIWQSRDLVNWTPLTAALKTNIGSVWAPELTRHNDRYFLFVPARFPDKCSIYVIHAEKPEGRWPGPINLNLPRHIDPGHADIEKEQGAEARLVMHRVGTQRRNAPPADFGKRLQRQHRRYIAETLHHFHC